MFVFNMYCTVIPGKRLPWYHRNTLITTTSITRQHGRSTGTMLARSVWTVSTTCRRSSPSSCVSALSSNRARSTTKTCTSCQCSVKQTASRTNQCVWRTEWSHPRMCWRWPSPHKTVLSILMTRPRLYTRLCHSLPVSRLLRWSGVGLVVTQWLTQTQYRCRDCRGVWSLAMSMLPMMGQILSKKEGHQRKKVSLVGCSEILLIKVTVSELR